MRFIPQSILKTLKGEKKRHQIGIFTPTLAKGSRYLICIMNQQRRVWDVRHSISQTWLSPHHLLWYYYNFVWQLLLSFLITGIFGTQCGKCLREGYTKITLAQSTMVSTLHYFLLIEVPRCSSDSKIPSIPQFFSVLSFHPS